MPGPGRNRGMTEPEPWMIDELAHAGPEHLDAAFVSGYDRKQGSPDPAEDLAVLAGYGLGDTPTVADRAAGTCQFAPAAARRFGRVVAVDVSRAMRDALRGRVAGAGPANVSFAYAERTGRDAPSASRSVLSLPPQCSGLDGPPGSPPARPPVPRPPRPFGLPTVRSGASCRA